MIKTTEQLGEWLINSAKKKTIYEIQDYVSYVS